MTCRRAPSCQPEGCWDHDCHVDHPVDELADRMDAEDRLRDKAPAGHEFGGIAVEGTPRWLHRRYRTGGKPTNNDGSEDGR